MLQAYKSLKFSGSVALKCTVCHGSELCIPLTERHVTVVEEPLVSAGIFGVVLGRVLDYLDPCSAI